MKPDFKLKNHSGIYQIRNNVNGKIYIGRSKCFYRRCYQYLYDFRERSLGHINDYLYKSMSKHGIEKFSFEVLEECPNYLTPERELYWITTLDSNNRDKGYNIRLDVDGKMLTALETSTRISSRLKKEWSEGSRNGHSDKLKLAWRNRDRNAQSSLMSKNLTKYSYTVTSPKFYNSNLNYKQLLELGFKNSVEVFFRLKSDIVMYKGCVVERKRLVLNGQV